MPQPNKKCARSTKRYMEASNVTPDQRIKEVFDTAVRLVQDDRLKKKEQECSKKKKCVIC